MNSMNRKAAITLCSQVVQSAEIKVIAANAVKSGYADLVAEDHVAKIIRRYVDRAAATKALIRQINERGT